MSKTGLLRVSAPSRELPFPSLKHPPKARRPFAHKKTAKPIPNPAPNRFPIIRLRASVVECGMKFRSSGRAAIHHQETLDRIMAPAPLRPASRLCGFARDPGPNFYALTEGHAAPELPTAHRPTHPRKAPPPNPGSAQRPVKPVNDVQKLASLWPPARPPAPGTARANPTAPFVRGAPGRAAVASPARRASNNHCCPGRFSIRFQLVFPPPAGGFCRLFLWRTTLSFLTLIPPGPCRK